MMDSKELRCALLALLILASASAVFVAESRAQNTEPQNNNRPRRAENVSQPSPTPPAKPEDETTLHSDEVIRVDTNLTNILFTAADKQKRFVTNLKREDIRVLEDGVPQEIFTFQQNVDLPLSLAILIDTSGSEERTLPEEKAAARSFLETVVRANKDEAAIVSFTGEVTLEQGLTGNIGRLRRAIDQVEFVPPSGYIGGGVVVGGTPPISGTQQALAGSTAIWDAIWATSNELLSDAAEHTRRAIILRYEFGINEGALKKITESTGGRAYFPRNERELRDSFAQIQNDLREQYLVAYSSSNKSRDGSYRHVAIEIVNPETRKENLRLNYRPGYFAKSPDSAQPKSSKKP